MFKLRFNRVQVAFLIIFGIFLFTNIVYSSQSDFGTPKTCSQIFGDCDNATIDDAFDSCNGTQSSSGDTARVQEVYINASSFLYGDYINVTCAFRTRSTTTNNMQVFYNDTNDWFLIESWSSTTLEVKNYSTTFKVNSTEGTHIVRCMINYCNNMGPCSISDECVDSGDSGVNWDNDDVNFTVTSRLQYNFWNLTNYTTGAEIASGQTFNRTNSSGSITYINVSANWTKTLDKAFIEHNGTGTFVNYTIDSSFIIGNWTNVTLNLSDATQFNRKNITIRAIYANGSLGASNSTSPALFFNLDPGQSPSVNSLWFEHLETNTNNTNLYTNLTIFVNLSDDVGIFAVTANLTYPNNISVILNLTGIPNPVNQTWNYTFNTTGFPLNQTGNYTIGLVLVNDTGDQSANRTFNYNFTVTNNLTLSASISPSTPSSSQVLTLSINVSDINGNSHQFPVNLTITCLNRTYVETNFSVSNINGSTSFDNCYAINSAGTSFDITINATDEYSNTNTTAFTFTTTSSSGNGDDGGGGGGGGAGGTTNVTIAANCTVTPKNCSDGIDNDCDGLTDCGDPDCSRDPVCKIEIKELNFTLSTDTIEIEQGKSSTIIASLLNTGNTLLKLNSTLTKECCDISIPESFELPIQGETDFSINIHVPLSQELGEYTVKIELWTGFLTKEKAFKIVVKKSSTISSLETIQGKLVDIEETVKKYEALGINVDNLKNMINNLKNILTGSKTNINKDELSNLESSVSNADKILNSLDKALLGFNIQSQKFLQENKWYLSFFAMTIVLSTYIATQVILPYHKLGIELKNLVDEEQSLVQARKDAEKQYFTRKIDEKTFFNIMVSKQGKILKARAMLKQREIERSTLIKSRLHPLAMARWVKDSTISVSRSIKSAPRTIHERIKNKLKRPEVQY